MEVEYPGRLHAPANHPCQSVPRGSGVTLAPSCLVLLAMPKAWPKTRGVLNGKKKKKKKKVFRFPKKPAGTPCAQPWLVAVGGWRLAAVGGWQLATGGWWRLVVVGGGWWLAVGGWRRLAVVGSWRLVAAGGWRRLVAGGWWRLVVGGWWRLAVDGSWRLAVGGPLGWSLRAVLSKKKKISSLKDAPAQNACQAIIPFHAMTSNKRCTCRYDRPTVL